MSFLSCFISLVISVIYLLCLCLVLLFACFSSCSVLSLIPFFLSYRSFSGYFLSFFCYLSISLSLSLLLLLLLLALPTPEGVSHGYALKPCTSAGSSLQARTGMADILGPNMSSILSLSLFFFCRRKRGPPPLAEHSSAPPWSRGLGRYPRQRCATNPGPWPRTQDPR